jgi:O-antigen ligase
MDLHAVDRSSIERELNPSAAQSAALGRVRGRLDILSGWFARLAALSLGITVFLSPLRGGLTVQDRSLPPLYYAYRNLVLYPSDVLALATLGFWALSLACSPRRLRVQPLWLTLPIAGLTLAAWASILASPDRVFSTYQSVRLLLMFALYIYAINELRSLRFVFLGEGAMIAVQGVIGVAQALRQHSIGLARLGELTLDPSQGGVSVVVSGALRSLRAYGLTDHPNILGGCLALALLLVIVWHFQIASSWRPLTGALAMLGALALLLTFSRSAWLGLAAGIILLILWIAQGKRWETLNLAMILCAACLLILAPFILQNAAVLGVRLGQNGSFAAATTENQAINERGLLAHLGWVVFSAHPVSGVGVGAFPQALHQINPHFPFALQPPHLVALDVAAETGVFGALFYLAAEVLPWIALFTQRKRLRASPELAGVTAALLAISVISLFDYYPWMASSGQLWQWLLWGSWASLYTASKGEPSHA